MRCKYAIATPTSSSESGRRAAACRKPLTRILSAAAALWLFVGASQAAAEGLTLQQCANGNIDDPVDHLECYDGWINGSANAQKAAFTENAFVPYRVSLTGLNIGETYTYSFSWDTMHQGLHGLDYVGTYNASITRADLCQGLAGVSCLVGTETTLLVPKDPEIAAAGVPQPDGVFTMYGGDLVTAGDYSSPDTESRAISVVFTATASNAVLGWGGHLSSPMDWGDGTTASDIKGSPYHVSNIALTNGSGEVVASGGQDVQLSAAAVYVPARINVSKMSNKDGTFSFESFIGTEAVAPDGEINPWTLGRDETKTLEAVKDGTVSIEEISLPPGDWRVASVVCSDYQGGQIFNYPERDNSPRATISAREGGTFNCVFTNEFFGAPVAEVTKKVIGSGEACTDAVRDSHAHESLDIRSGETVKYCYWVTNTGSDTLLDVTLVDDMGTPNDTYDDATITLAGGGDVDGQLDAPDLVVGDYVSGELIVTHDIALGTTVTNVAEGQGVGQTDQQTHGDTDTASVTANIASSCSLTATVSTNPGACDGGPTVYALDGTEIYWCANVSWDGGAILDLTDVSVSLDNVPSVGMALGDMSPGASAKLEIGSMLAGANDFTGTMRLKGLEGGLNPVECSGAATVDVVGPDLQLRKTVMAAGGTCGVDDATSIEVIYGDSVEYCFAMENAGDVPLTQVTLDDAKIELTIQPNGGIMAAAETTVFKSDPVAMYVTDTNTAVANALEPLTGTKIGPEQSSATVNVLAADVSVDKRIDTTTIVVCDAGDINPYCSEVNAQGLYDGVYSIVVSNAGPTDAWDVTVTDTLPDGVKVISADSRCDISGAPLISCYLGDMKSATSETLYLSVEIDPGVFEFPWGTITNTACANTNPAQLDPDASNNCDSASTRLATGATHTIGYWKTHETALSMCTGTYDGQELPIDLGFITLRSETYSGEIDATVSTDPDAKGKLKSSMITAEVPANINAYVDEHAISPIDIMTRGLLGANVSSWSDGTPRSALGQARTKTSRQLIAAWCNEQVLGSKFAKHFLSWEKIRAIMVGEAYLSAGVVVGCDGPCETRVRDVIDSITELNRVADEFNNSGLDLEDGLPQEPANTKAPKDDPTDPGVESPISTATSLDASTNKGKGNGRK